MALRVEEGLYAQTDLDKPCRKSRAANKPEVIGPQGRISELVGQADRSFVFGIPVRVKAVFQAIDQQSDRNQVANPLPRCFSLVPTSISIPLALAAKVVAALTIASPARMQNPKPRATKSFGESKFRMCAEANSPLSVANC